jgi:hypothetical protein
MGPILEEQLTPLPRTHNPNERLGHASIATTERYTAVDDSEIRAAMESAHLAARTVRHGPALVQSSRQIERSCGNAKLPGKS